MGIWPKDKARNTYRIRKMINGTNHNVWHININSLQNAGSDQVECRVDPVPDKHPTAANPLTQQQDTEPVVGFVGRFR